MVWKLLLLPGLLLGVSAPLAQAACPTNCACSSEQVTCNCAAANNQLTLAENAFPNPTTVKEVSISNCLIPSIATGAFSQLTAVERVSFSSCFVAVILPDAFKDMRFATDADSSITFTYSTLHTVAQYAFRGIHNLDYLTSSLLTIESLGNRGIADTDIGNIVLSLSKITSLEEYAFGSGLDNTNFSLSVSEMAAAGEIPRYTFAGISSSRISMDVVALGTFEKNAFAGVNDVTISITTANITGFDSQAFQGARNLRSLTLRGSAVGHIGDDVLGDMTAASTSSSVTLSDLIINNVEGVPFMGLAGFGTFTFSGNIVQCRENATLVSVQASTVVNSNNQLAAVSSKPCRGAAGCVLPSLLLSLFLALTATLRIN